MRLVRSIVDAAPCFARLFACLLLGAHAAAGCCLSRCNSCKEYQNLHTFFAIVLGLSNTAVSRLTQTWERLPSKVKRVYSQFETLIDPSRNQRLYRLYLSTLEPPVIPFTPLLLKDMTFAHEGNKTFLERDMVNFEKMVRDRHDRLMRLWLRLMLLLLYRDSHSR